MSERLVREQAERGARHPVPTGVILAPPFRGPPSSPWERFFDVILPPPSPGANVAPPLPKRVTRRRAAPLQQTGNA